MLRMNRSLYNTGAGAILGNATCPSTPSLGLLAMTNRMNFDALASVPSGYPASVAIVPPMFPGAMSSYRKGVLTIGGAATGALGLNGEAAGTLSLVGSAIGGLIAGGVASGTITVDGTVVMFAALGAVGTGLITVGGTASASAIGHLLASGTVTVNGAATPYGVGWMDGTSDFGSELTPGNLASAVWNAVAAEMNSAGTMGALLNGGSAGGLTTDQATQLLEIFQRLGLDVTKPLAQTATSISTADWALDVTESSGTVTVERQ